MMTAPDDRRPCPDIVDATGTLVRMASTDQVVLSDGHVSLHPIATARGVYSWSVHRHWPGEPLGSLELRDESIAGSPGRPWERVRAIIDSLDDEGPNHIQTMARGLDLACLWVFAHHSSAVVWWLGAPSPVSQAIVYNAGFRSHALPVRGAFDQAVERGDGWYADRTPEDTRSSNIRPLTNREHQVLAEMAQGRSNMEIALRLGISDNTVKNHVRAILDAFQAPSRTAAVVRALSAAMVSLPSPDAPPTRPTN